MEILPLEEKSLSLLKIRILVTNLMEVFGQVLVKQRIHGVHGVQKIILK